MTPTAFTVGRTSSYDQSLREEAVSKKMGAHPEWDEPYEGGWVWRSREAAQAFLDSGRIEEVSDLRDPSSFSVYGLLLPSGWEKDVSPEPHPSDGVHRLLHDSPFVAL